MRERDHPLTQREFEHARTAYFIIEVSSLRSRLERVPTKGHIARAALGIIFCSAAVRTFLNWWPMAPWAATIAAVAVGLLRGSWCSRLALSVGSCAARSRHALSHPSPKRSTRASRGSRFTLGEDDRKRPDMRLDLTDEEAAALLRELNNIIENDRYPFSLRIRTLRTIRATLPGAPAPPPLARPPTQEERDPRRAPRGTGDDGQGELRLLCGMILDGSSLRATFCQLFVLDLKAISYKRKLVTELPNDSVFHGSIKISFGF